MGASQVFSILAAVAAMVIGQVLFKLASTQISLPALTASFVMSLLTNIYMIVGIALYAATTILWVFVLRDVPISRAYPFMALSMVIVPLTGVLFFNEPASWSLLLGGGMIIAGLVVVSW